MEIVSFYMDKYPVTNALYKRFLDASGYKPRDDYNFLKDWKDGTYPAGWDRKPVTWVSLEDARAYAAWANKRLPHEWEWQYAAQGTNGRLYPWGNQPDAAATPKPETGPELRGPPTWMCIRAAPAPSASWTCRGMSGNGLTSSSMITPARRCSAAAVNTGPAVRAGTSRRPQLSTSTRDTCSWPRARTARARSASVAWRIGMNPKRKVRQCKSPRRKVEHEKENSL